MKLESELYETRCGGKGVYWNCESEVEHDAMAAHALLQAAKGVESDYVDRKEIVDACEVIRLRAAEILAGWLGDRG